LSGGKCEKGVEQPGQPGFAGQPGAQGNVKNALEKGDSGWGKVTGKRGGGMV